MNRYLLSYVSHEGNKIEDEPVNAIDEGYAFDRMKDRIKEALDIKRDWGRQDKSPPPPSL